MVGCMLSLPRFSTQIMSIWLMTWSRLKSGSSDAYKSNFYQQELRSATSSRESREEPNKDAS